MTEKELGVSIDGYVATVEMRRPPNNFLDVEFIGELASAPEALDEDPNCRSLVLAAAGKHFCAGANLKKRVDDEAAGKKQVALPRHLYHEAQRLVQTCKPILAAVQGSAIGAGLGLALVADFRVTCKEARLAANFDAMGYHPGFGMTVTLPRLNMYGANRRLVVEQKALAGILGHTYNLLAFRKHVMRERAIQRRLQYKTTMDTFKAAMIAEGADGYATDNEALYLQAWQHLIDTGTCWQLQGWFGRTARDLIESGQCRPAQGGAA